jgi:hypothetical protein
MAINSTYVISQRNVRSLFFTIFARRNNPMRICFTFDHKTFCVTVPPIILYPFPPAGPDPGPEHPEYTQLVSDASILASMHAVTNQIADAGVRKALQSGLNEALKAAQKRGGENVKLAFEG